MAITAALLALAASACSNTDAPDHDVTQTSAGLAGGDLVAWAGSVCELDRTTWGMDATAPPVPTAAADVVSYVTDLRAYAAHSAEMYGDAAEAAKSLEPAPVDGGDQVTLQVQEAYQAGAGAYQEVVSMIDAFDPGGADALTRAAALQDAINDAYRQKSDAFEGAIGSGKAMSDAFRSAPACQAAAS